MHHELGHTPPMLDAGPRRLRREVSAWAATLAWWHAERLPNPRRARDVAVQHLHTYPEASQMGHRELRRLIEDASVEIPKLPEPGVPHKFDPAPGGGCMICGLATRHPLHAVGGDSLDKAVARPAGRPARA